MARDDVVVRFGGDTQAYRAAISRIDESIVGLRGRLSSGLAGLGAGLGLGGITAEFATFVNDLDSLGKAAQSLGTTTEQLYQLQFAVGQTSALTQDEFIGMLQRLLRHTSRANEGVKESQEIFQDLGVSWETLARMDVAAQFLHVVDAMSALEERTARVNVAYRLFEEPWRTALPTLETAPETLRSLMEQVTPPTTEAAASAARLNDSLDLMNRRLEQLSFVVGPPVINFLNDIIPLLTRASEVAVDFGAKAVDGFRAVEQELQSWGPLGEILRRIIDPTAALRDAIEQLPSTETTPAATVAATPSAGISGTSMLGAASAAQTKAESKKVKAIKTEAVEDTRAQVRAEAALWDHYHAEISALQEGNAMAAKAAQEAQLASLAQLVAAGASETRRAFYEAMVGEETTVPSTAMRVILDEESLLALPDELEAALQQGNYSVTLQAQVVPTLLSKEGLERAVDQSGASP